MFSGTAQVSHQVCQFCGSSCACDYGGYKEGCRVLFASHIGLNIIRKEKKNIKCGVRSGIWKGIYYAMLVCWMNC